MPGRLRNLPPLHPRHRPLQVQPSRKEDFPLYDTIFLPAATPVLVGRQDGDRIPERQDLEGLRPQAENLVRGAAVRLGEEHIEANHRGSR